MCSATFKMRMLTVKVVLLATFPPLPDFFYNCNYYYYYYYFYC